MTLDQIIDFKAKLNEGLVSFTYKKKDGSIRPANGTTDPQLLPVQDTYNYDISNIQWNVSGDTTLPSTAAASLSVDIPENDLKDNIADWLYTQYGTMPIDFDIVEKLKRVKRPNEDIITYFDIDKGGWRSFNKNQLISYN